MDEEKETTTENIDRFYTMMTAGIVFTYQDFKSFDRQDQEDFLVAAQLHNEYKHTMLKQAIADVVLPDEEVMENYELQKRAMEAQARFNANFRNA